MAKQPLSNTPYIPGGGRPARQKTASDSPMRIQYDISGIQQGETSRYDDTPTPADYLERSMQTEMQSLNEAYRGKWNMIQEHVKYLGPDKAQAMLSELMIKGQNDVAQIRAKAEQRKAMLSRIENLRNQGLIPDQREAERVMWEFAGGKELAEVMFPEQPSELDQVRLAHAKLNYQQDLQGKQPDAISEFSKLSAHAGRLESQVGKFNVVEGTVGQWWKPQRWEKKTKTIEKWVPEVGEFVTAENQNEAFAELSKWQNELLATRNAMKNLDMSGSLSNPLLKASARLYTGENPHGTFGDKVGASKLMTQANKPKTVTLISPDGTVYENVDPNEAKSAPKGWKVQ